MPPEFEARLSSKNIPYEQRENGYTIVDINSAITAGGFADAHEVTRYLLETAAFTDAEFFTNFDPEIMEFRPKS